MNIETYSIDAVSRRISAGLKAAVNRHGKAGLAIPGGRSPGPVLNSLAGSLPEEVVRETHLYWVDERAVAPGHDDRNDKTTLVAWQKGGELPGHVHVMPAESADLEGACLAYANLLNDFSAGLSVCLLGIGEDGHFASLFPDHPGLNNKERIFYLTDSPKPPSCRMSMSLPFINQSEELFVLALGDAKGRVLRKIRDEGSNPFLPASLLSERAVWFADEAALKHLK